VAEPDREATALCSPARALAEYKRDRPVRGHERDRILAVLNVVANAGRNSVQYLIAFSDQHLHAGKVRCGTLRGPLVEPMR
jgi:hypothetical protein